MSLKKSQLHVALIEPEIPPNTGNIARLCGATFTTLHLVGKLGFRTDDKAVKRAGLDYWDEVDIHYHQPCGALPSLTRMSLPLFHHQSRAPLHGLSIRAAGLSGVWTRDARFA